MMGLNAPSHDVPFGVLRQVAQGTTDDEIAKLLALGWRARVMGAWLASGRAQRLEAPLLKSLKTSAGSLTAPPLATVALYGLGVKAVPSLKAYLRLDLEHEWGSASFVAAVLERLDDTSAGVAVDDRDRGAVWAHRARRQDRWHRPSHPVWTSLLRAVQAGTAEQEPRNSHGVSTCTVSTRNFAQK
jgi:hypothetical protein